MCGDFLTRAVHKLYLLGQWVSCNFPKVVAFDQPVLSRIVDKGTLHTAAADVEAALVLCPLKTEVSIRTLQEPFLAIEKSCQLKLVGKAFGNSLAAGRSLS